jgi:hypothetical protein
MRQLLFAAALLCLITMPARADMTGNDLKSYCQFYPRHTEASAACMGYIFGSLGTIHTIDQIFKFGWICEPPGVTGEQVIAMTMKYLSDHPADLHLSASSLLFDMYTSSFGCSKKR